VHATPHAPQLAGSLFSVTQLLPQRSVAAGQVRTHAPSLHAWPAAHAAPHAPQLAASPLVSTHVPAQSA
jgi:hypothetical protein